MTRAECCVLVFESVHDVMNTERRLKSVAVWCDLVPTPRQISSECGMSVEVHQRDLEQVLDLLGKDRELVTAYRVSGDAYEVVEV